MRPLFLNSARSFRAFAWQSTAKADGSSYGPCCSLIGYAYDFPLHDRRQIKHEQHSQCAGLTLLCAKSQTACAGIFAASVVCQRSLSVASETAARNARQCSIIDQVGMVAVDNLSRMIRTCARCKEGDLHSRSGVCEVCEVNARVVLR